MANKLFVAGSSGNKAGRPVGTRYSILTTKGRIERFLSKNMTATAMQRLYNSLPPKDQFNLLSELLPYVLPKQSTESISKEEIDKLHTMVENALKQKDRAIG